MIEVPLSSVLQDPHQLGHFDIYVYMNSLSAEVGEFNIPRLRTLLNTPSRLVTFSLILTGG